MRPYSLIVSCSENRVIGRDGKLPWSIPEDQQFFHQQTAGQIVIMGRVGYQTWPKAAAEGRRAIVITSDQTLRRPGIVLTSSLPEALAAADGLPGDIYICGGERIYQESIVRPEATRLFLTLVHAQVVGTTHFPDWREAFTRETARREGADANWQYTFLTLERG
jgi:dihydrofolate reductase